MKNLFLALILFVGFISCKKDIEQKSNITIYFGGPIITMTGDNADDEPFANNNDGALVVMIRYFLKVMVCQLII